jgi:hypothetical protein
VRGPAASVGNFYVDCLADRRRAASHLRQDITITVPIPSFAKYARSSFRGNRVAIRFLPSLATAGRRLFLTWMGGRAVEGTGLENRRARKGSVGSNPTPSAIDHI